jgi:hypothetical protein
MSRPNGEPKTQIHSGLGARQRVNPESESQKLRGDCSRSESQREARDEKDCVIHWDPVASYDRVSK